jgi:hypothetical protein
MESLRESAGTEYDILGFLGQQGGLKFVYLAREMATGELAALILESEGTDGSGEPAFSITIKRELDGSVPDPETLCPRCRAKLRRWARFCTQCGQDVSGISATSGSRHSRATLLGAVRSAAGDEYEVLGEMSRTEGGGLVYFARDLSSGKIVALRLDRAGEEEYSVNVTRVLKPLPSRPAGAPAPQRISLVRKMTDEERRSVEGLATQIRGKRESASTAPAVRPVTDLWPLKVSRRVVLALVIFGVFAAAVFLALAG